MIDLVSLDKPNLLALWEELKDSVLFPQIGKPDNYSDINTLPQIRRE